LTVDVSLANTDLTGATSGATMEVAVSRLIRLFAFAVSFMSLQPAFADRDHDNGHGRDDEHHHTVVSVPELSTHGAAAGLALIAGAAAIVLGRRRSRRA
jgi:hypothetical protein